MRLIWDGLSRIEKSCYPTGKNYKINVPSLTIESPSSEHGSFLSQHKDWEMFISI